MAGVVCTLTPTDDKLSKLISYMYSNAQKLAID